MIAPKRAATATFGEARPNFRYGLGLVPGRSISSFGRPFSAETEIEITAYPFHVFCPCPGTNILYEF